MPVVSEYKYTDGMSRWSHPYLKATLEKFVADMPSGAAVLDFGCGNGSLLDNFRNRGWRLHGIDISHSGIDNARMNRPDIAFYRADLTGDLSTTFRGQQFDLIISTEVIEHVYSPREFAQNCFRLLRPGGRLVISTPYHGYCKNLVLAIAGRMDAHFTALWDHGHIKFWSRHTLSRVLHEAGFQNLQFAGAGRVPFLWKSMVFKAVKPIEPYGSDMLTCNFSY